jgi:hypothetical protein
MSRCQFTVEEVFTVMGRGIALVGFPPEQYDFFRVGDQVELKRPDGSVLYTTIVGVEYPPSTKWLGKRPENARHGLIVDAAIEDAPIGSEVWLQ